MSTTIYDQTVDEVVDLEKNKSLLVHLNRHENGAVSLIHQDTEPICIRAELSDPIGNLVVERAGYHHIGFEEPLGGIQEARDQAQSILEDTDFRDGPWEYHGESDVAIIDKRSGWDAWLDVSDPVDSSVFLAYMFGWDTEDAVRHYIDYHEPDVAYYHHKWHVHGCAQSEWVEGWGYVLQSDMDNTDASDAKQVFLAELEDYRLESEGEVFHVKLVEPTGLQYGMSEQGGFYTGEQAGELTEDVGLVVGLNHADLTCADLAGSPITSTEYR